VDKLGVPLLGVVAQVQAHVRILGHPEQVLGVLAVRRQPPDVVLLFVAASRLYR
jgi:hypothetical protein